MNKQIARQGISWVSSNWLSFGRVSNIKNELLTFLELSPFFFKINFQPARKITKNKMSKYEIGNKFNEIENPDLIIFQQSN